MINACALREVFVLNDLDFDFEVQMIRPKLHYKVTVSVRFPLARNLGKQTIFYEKVAVVFEIIWLFLFISFISCCT